ncbi:MAG: DUF2189 domain-containing protein [Bradyrhizobium sp.]|nr:DUF2189 domain-containing protein [Bradyrhizobium sp.]
MTIRNPVEWSADQLELSAHALKSIGHAFWHPDVDVNIPKPEVERISVADLKDVLLSGLRDFAAYRTDVIFLCLIYPLTGFVLASVTLHFELLPLLFPLISGFALIGPFGAAGLYEMSRRQEQGKPVSWIDAFGVFGSPSIAEIIKLGLLLIAIFLLWLATAMVIYRLTLGPAMPTSLPSFVTDVFTTPAGWALIGVGIGIGLLFALVVLAISVVSFPLLLDRPVNVSTAVRTSTRAVMLNPVPMLIWGLIVAGSLMLGAIPALVGLIMVMPVLGHATWHLYRKVILPRTGARAS